MNRHMLRSIISKCSAAIVAIALLIGDSPVYAFDDIQEVSDAVYVEAADDGDLQDEYFGEDASEEILTEEEDNYPLDAAEADDPEYEEPDIDSDGQDYEKDGGDDSFSAAPFSVVIRDFAPSSALEIKHKNELPVGHGYPVEYEIVPEGYSDSVSVTISSSEDEVASINTETGMVFPYKYGYATITVTAVDKVDNTISASADIEIKCVYPTGKFFEFYGKRFAFTEYELYETGWLSVYGNTALTEKKSGNWKVYYFKDGKAYSKKILELEGEKYIFDTSTCELVKEWAPINTFHLEDIPADANPSGPIADNMLSYGTSYVLTAKFEPDYANDSLDPEWESDDPSTIKVTPLGWNGNEVHARLDVLKRSDTPVEIKVSVGEPENRKTDTVNVYARYPLGWHDIAGKKYYGKIKPGTPVDVEHVTGLTTIGGREYYFEPDGHMFTGMKEIGGVLYDFAENGVKRAQFEKRGFVDTPEGTVFYNDLGVIEKNKIISYGDGFYYADGEGIIQKGYFTIGGRNYCSLTEDTGEGEKAGKLLDGFVLADGKWRLFADKDAADPFAELTSSSDSGWIHAKDDSKRYYRKPEGKFLKGWQTLDGNKYYFNEDGSVASGLTEIGGKYYCFGENISWDYTECAPSAGDDYGIMKTGRVLVGGHVYFFADKGNRLTGWQKYTEGGADKWDFFDLSTAKSYNAAAIPGMPGWYEIDRGGDLARYYFKDNSTLAKGWFNIEDKRYYFDTAADADGITGRMAVGIRTIGSSKYYFCEKAGSGYGTVLTGYDSAEDAGGIMRTYFADKSGALKLGWQKPVAGGPYAFFDYARGYKLDNAYAEGNSWATIEEVIGGVTHYYRSYFKNGTNPVTGLQTIGGRKYFFGNDKKDRNYGRVMTCLIKNGSTLYYGRPYDETALAEAEDPDAGMLENTGWFTVIEGGVAVTRYASGSGMLLKGWQTLDGKKYYFDTQTGALAKGVTVIGKNRYVFDDATGMMLTGYCASGAEHYFTNGNGIMQYGYIVDGGVARFFVSDPGSAYYGMEKGYAPLFSFGTSGDFYECGGMIFYVKNGKMQTGWQTLTTDAARRHYFDQNGLLKTGVFNIGKTVYISLTKAEAEALGHVEYTGSAVSGFVSSGPDTYYYDTNGKRLTGWVKNEGEYYYFDPSTGAMKTGMFPVGKKTYYSDASGKRQTGFIALLGNTYYFDPQGGAMKTGWQTIKTGGISRKYHFDENGRMAKMITAVSGKKYVFTADGELLVNFYGTPSGMTGKYVSDAKGVMKTGWNLIESNWHYFDASGKEQVLAGEPEEIDGVIWYTVAELPEGNRKSRARFAFKNGKSLKGWQTIKTGGKSRKYYFDETGKMTAGFAQMDGKRYYFSETADATDPTMEGMLLSGGINNVSGRYYFMASSGAFCTGWFSEGGKKYYADPATGELATGFVNLDGNIYYFNEAESEAGQLQMGFIKLSDRGQTYYDGTAGASNMYYADSDGVIAHSGWINVKDNAKVKDSQEWSYYAAPNRPYADMGDFILTGELACGDVLIDDEGNVSAYIDDGQGAADGFAAGQACKKISADGVLSDGSVTGPEIGRYYRFNSSTCARRKEVLFFFGNYYGDYINDDQRSTVSSMRRFIDSGGGQKKESEDFILVNTDRAALIAKGLTSYPGNVFPMCASSSVSDEQPDFDPLGDLNSDGHVDVYDTEIYSKDVYDHAIAKYGPRNLVLSGASSGAGICLGLYDHAIQKGSPLKLPAEVLLMSPWVDVRMNNEDAAGLTKRQTGSTDIDTLKYWGARYTRDAGYVDESGEKPYEGIAGPGGIYPFATPLLLDSSGMKNVYMYSGTYDPCYYDCAKFVKEAEKHGNTSVKLNKYTGARHGFMFFSEKSSAKSEVILDVCRKIMTEEP